MVGGGDKSALSAHLTTHETRDCSEHVRESENERARERARGASVFDACAARGIRNVIAIVARIIVVNTTICCEDAAQAALCFNINCHKVP